jgi:hypothetical protein
MFIICLIIHKSRGGVLMNKLYCVGFLLIGFIFSQCADMNKIDCMLSQDCNWDENMVTGNCDNFSSPSTCWEIDQCDWVSTNQSCPSTTVYSTCVAVSGCSYSWLTYSCSGGGTTVTECTGGSYQFDNGSCNEVLMPECSDLNESDCYLNNSCEWNESITYGNCGSLSVSACYDYPGQCYVDSNPGWYDSSGPYCTGGTYQIDNSTCDEIEILECSEMSQFQCSNDSVCDWIEDVEIIYCNTLPTQGWGPGVCEWYYPDCYNYLDYGGSYGSWSTECGGGTTEIDSSYCSEAQYLLGDINQDNTINIQDVILAVNLVLNMEYNSSVDMNSDNILNILDIIQLVSLILNS